MKKQKNVTPWLPEITLDEVLAYEHDKPETHTSSPLVNAVCEKMFAQPLLMPEAVAQSLGVERIKLTHAMELLTGHSLNDIRLEMMVKRWREYRQAHPDCKEKELAALLGYENYNAYWRFMERHRKHFPELKEEDDDLRGHVMSVLEPLMRTESTTVRRLYGLLPYRGGKAEAEACARRLYRHGKHVADMAEAVLERHPELQVQRQTLREAALLQMVGIVWTDAPELHCHGHEPMEQWHAMSANFLSKRQQNIAARCAIFHHPTASLHHTLTSLVCYASCFYSIFAPDRKKTPDEVRATLLATYGATAVESFDTLHRLFA